MTLNQDDYLRVKRFRLGEIPSYEVLVDDFDRIEDEAQDVGLAFHFAVFCLSGAFTLSITLATVPIASWHVKATFLLAMCGGYVVGSFFLVLALRQRDRLKKMMQKIRDRQIAPLGEKDSELGPSELQQLPSEAGESTEDKT
jgi:fructose-specific phosphotransferase system IIC component